MTRSTKKITSAAAPTPALFGVLGVPLSLQSSNGTLLDEAFEAIKNFFPSGVELATPSAKPHVLRFASTSVGHNLTSEFGSQKLDADRNRFLKHVRSLARIIVAANAPDLLFIHAGVISWKGKGIVIPGDSHSGKTTLVRELVRRGALYYSDEYAVLDTKGLILPFPKPLSVRGIEGPEIQTEIQASSVGSIARRPTRASVVLLTQYVKASRWRPRILGGGEGVLRLVPHTIGFAKRPEFALNTLRKAFEKSTFFESNRSDARVFGRVFLETLDK